MPPPLCQHTDIQVGCFYFPLFARDVSERNNTPSRGRAREILPGVFNRASVAARERERAGGDERESVDEEDNRGESEVRALLLRLSKGRKSSAFWSRTQSEIEPANQKNQGLGEAPAFIDTETKSTCFFFLSLDLFASPPLR